MTLYLAVRPSDGAMHVLKAKDEDAAYRLYGREVLGMEGDIDTGNVDIDLYELPKVAAGQVVALESKE